MAKSVHEALLKFAEHDDGTPLELPLSMLMQTIFLGGNKGAGKTSAMKRLFEAAHAARAQCVAIAPLGKWWSLRISKNGRGPGLSGVVVFGGKNGDVPIVAGSGRTIARVLVHRRLHAVLDVEQMRKNDRAIFLADLFEELMQLKKAENAPSPMVVFVDEAQAIAPQKSTSKEVERLRELMGDFCRECRNYGAGLVLGAQRSANVDKDLLALVEMLLVMRTVHHIDRSVYAKWVDEKGSGDEDDSAWLRRLRRLEKGEGYLYAPELNVFERVKVLLPDTFDATKTATIGAKVAKVGKLSKLDVRKLGEELTTVVETAAANDPTKLRGQRDAMEADNRRLTDVVRGLREQLSKPPKSKPGKLDKRTLKRVERAAKSGREVMHKLEALIEELKNTREAFRDGARDLDVAEKLQLPKIPSAVHPMEARGAEKARFFGEHYSASPKTLHTHLTRGYSVGQPIGDVKIRGVSVQVEAPKTNGEVKLGRGERAIMVAITQIRNGATREQLTVITGYKRSTRDAYVARLIQAGYAWEKSGLIEATETGIAWLGSDFKPLPTGSALREHWLKTLPSGEAKILALFTSDVTELPREAISEKTGFKTSTRNAYIYRLLARQLLVERTRNCVQASQHLFEAQ